MTQRTHRLHAFIGHALPVAGLALLAFFVWLGAGCSLLPNDADVPLTHRVPHCPSEPSAAANAALGAVKGLPGGGIVAGAVAGARARNPADTLDDISYVVEECTKNTLTRIAGESIPERDMPGDQDHHGDYQRDDFRCYCYRRMVHRQCIVDLVPEVYCPVGKHQAAAETQGTPSQAVAKDSAPPPLTHCEQRARDAELREIIKRAEGDPFDEITANGHLCFGHKVLANETFDTPMTDEECEALLTTDIAEACNEGMRVLSRSDNGIIEAVYWRGTRAIKKGTAASVAEHIRGYAPMLRTDADRTARIADAVDAAETPKEGT